jgi:hypothetical protein
MIDLYALPINLKFETRDSVKTKSGMLMTFILIILTILFGSYSIYAFLLKKNITLTMIPYTRLSLSNILPQPGVPFQEVAFKLVPGPASVTMKSNGNCSLTSNIINFDKNLFCSSVTNQALLTQGVNTSICVNLSIPISMNSSTYSPTDFTSNLFSQAPLQCNLTKPACFNTNIGIEYPISYPCSYFNGVWNCQDPSCNVYNWQDFTIFINLQNQIYQSFSAICAYSFIYNFYDPNMPYSNLALNCAPFVPAFIHVSFVVLQIDTGILFQNFESYYTFTLDTTGINELNAAQTEYLLNPLANVYTIQAPLLPQVLAAITGIASSLLVIMRIGFSSLRNFERQMIISDYILKKVETSKENLPTLTVMDFIKAKFFCNKQAKAKLEFVEAIQNRLLIEKLELSHVIDINKGSSQVFKEEKIKTIELQSKLF